MTDKQDTHDRTHTTGQAEGRRRASGAHTEDGTRHGDGETEGDTTEHSRRHTAAGREQGESRQTEKSM